MMDNGEIPKYRKKKKSSTSKAKMKADHQHEYVVCLFVENGYPRRGTYCKVCGKIGNIAFHEVQRLPDGCFRVMDDDEVFEMYKDLEQIEIESVFQRYINIDNKKDEE
jgi:hypothetical protein